MHSQAPSTPPEKGATKVKQVPPECQLKSWRYCHADRWEFPTFVWTFNCDHQLRQGRMQWQSMTLWHKHSGQMFFFTLRHTLLNTHTISYYHNYQNTADRLNIWSHQIDILSHHVLSWRVDPETSTDKSPKAVQGCNTAQEFQTHCSSFTAIRILSWNRVDSNCTRFHSFSPSRNYMNSGHPGRSAGPGKSMQTTHINQIQPI